MKSVVVTGICGGIGHALLSQLVQGGWAIYGLDCARCPDASGLAHFWQEDAADETVWSEKVVPVVSRDESLCAFVHVAAIQPCQAIIDTTAAEWDRTMAVNLKAAFLGARFLAPLMQHNGGSIVNVASVHAVATSAGMAAYVASKGGLVAFTRAAAVELAGLKIRVNAVLPGAVETTMLSKGLSRSPAGSQAARSQLIESTPLRRIGSPREIAKAIGFLLDDDQASFITGQCLVVDGGASIKLATE